MNRNSAFHISIPNYVHGKRAQHAAPDVAARRCLVVTSTIMHVLAPGMNLGRFKLMALVGKGGMGEVWRAQDSRLSREVAIKVLPPEMENPELRARFERESKLLAAMNHPNIAQIYEAGEEQVVSPAFPGKTTTVSFLVMEFIVGRSLADVLQSGPLPVLTVVRLARQVGKALAVAHKAGIIHRDLKPANIMVTPGSKVKVLDFGLARPLAAATPTGLVTMPEVTVSGVVLGTAAYLSPEQIRGEQATVQSDLWAFGCVLYQMLGGKRPFPGNTIPETLASILRDDPPSVSQFNPDVPPALKTVVEQCLDKDPGRRPASALDVVSSLKDLLQEMRHDPRRSPGPEEVSTPAPAFSFDASQVEAINRYLKAINPSSPQMPIRAAGVKFVEIVYRGVKIGLLLGARPDSVDPLLAFVTVVTRIPAQNRDGFFRKLLSLSNSETDMVHLSIDAAASLVNLVCVRSCSHLNAQQLRLTLDVMAITSGELKTRLNQEAGG